MRPSAPQTRKQHRHRNERHAQPAVCMQAPAGKFALQQAPAARHLTVPGASRDADQPEGTKI
jgi:hypothetical protein